MDSSSLISSKDEKSKSNKIKDADEASRRRKEQAKKAPKPMDFEVRFVYKGHGAACAKIIYAK